MYITKGETLEKYKVKTTTNDFEYFLDYGKDAIGLSPVGHLNIALVGCISMVVKSYFYNMGINDVKVDVISKLEPTNIEVEVNIDTEVSENEKERIIKYMEERCTVYKMLSKDIKITKKVLGKND